MKWTTKDGRVLRLSEMSTDHLKNAAAMLRRKGYCSVDEFELSWSALSMCQGEMASYYAEQACADLRPTRALDALDAEIATRKDK